MKNIYTATVLLFTFPLLAFSQKYEPFSVKVKNRVNIKAAQVSFASDFSLKSKGFVSEVSQDEISHLLNTCTTKLEFIEYRYEPWFSYEINIEKIEEPLNIGNTQTVYWNVQGVIYLTNGISRNKLRRFDEHVKGKQRKLPTLALKAILETIEEEKVKAYQELISEARRASQFYKIPEFPSIGVYMSIEELLNNSPSIFLTEEEILDSNVRKNWFFDCLECLGIKNKNSNEIWGLYDGTKFMYQENGVFVGLIKYQNSLAYNMNAIKVHYGERLLLSGGTSALQPNAPSNKWHIKTAKNEILLLNLETGEFEKTKVQF